MHTYIITIKEAERTRTMTYIGSAASLNSFIFTLHAHLDLPGDRITFDMVVQ